MRWMRIAGTTLLLPLAALAPQGARAVHTSDALQAQSSETRAAYRIPPALADGWATSSLEAVGMNRDLMERMTEAVRRTPDWNVHAVLVERRGRLVYEEYFSGLDQRWGQSLGRVTFARETKHDLRSITKSVVSALIGIALRSGAIRSLDTPLVEFFPEYPELNTADRRRITLRHALEMRSGLQWNEDVPY